MSSSLSTLAGDGILAKEPPVERSLTEARHRRVTVALRAQIVRRHLTSSDHLFGYQSSPGRHSALMCDLVSKSGVAFVLKIITASSSSAVRVSAPSFMRM